MQLHTHIARLGLVAALVLAGTAPATAGGAPDIGEAMAERIAGDPAAPVTIVEYASFTCPLCAAFHTGADYRELRARYIDTGRARLIFRDFPLDSTSLRASMAARCAGTRGYFGHVRALYRSQDKWTRADDPAPLLAEITGLDDATLDTCFRSQELRDGLFRLRQQGVQAGVQFTPTFIVNGTVYPGSYSIEEFAEIIDPLVADN